MDALRRFKFDVKMFDQGMAEFVEAYDALLKEVEELREYKANATRKHWQQKAGESYLKWQFAESKLRQIENLIYGKVFLGPEETDEIRDILKNKLPEMNACGSND